jgi:GDP-L-fucose synthase
MINLKDKRIAVTGGDGFLGQWVVRRLRDDRGCRNVSAADMPAYDLRDVTQIRRMYDDLEPEIVIHLAALVGGIGANLDQPGRFFYDNAVMGIQLIHEGHLRNVEKMVILGSVCCYPKCAPIPFKEDDLWNGYPEEATAPYGLAKKMLLVQVQAYRQQYGMNSIFLMPVNLYGPGDHFDPQRSHVVPALIKKFVDATASGEPVVRVWGSGKATREFLYVDDAAEGIILAAERYDKSGPVNLGSGAEIAIRDLAEMIARITGFKGEIAWETDKPEGQPRRGLDTYRAREEFGFVASTPLETGLRETIAWYTGPMAK